MDTRTRLFELAERPERVGPEDYLALAVGCHELAIAMFDIRYIVIEDCLRLADSFWVNGAVTAPFADLVNNAWRSGLGAALIKETEQAGCQVALALLDTLRATGPLGPQIYGLEG